MMRVPLALAALACLSLLAAPLASTGTSAKRFRVGLVLPPGGTKAPVFQSSVQGLRRAVRELGVEGKVLTGSPKEGDLPSLLSLARQRYDLIMSEFPVETEEAALRYPKAHFVGFFPYTLLKRRPRNVWGVIAAHQQAGYLTGYLAALMEKRRPGNDVVSSVGGFKFANVDDWIAGYQAGARKADPGITVLNGYSGSFTDPSKCRAIALDQIARGSHVIFNVAGECGPGTLQAAEEKRVWGIGVDVDQSSFGPRILTSAVMHADVAVFDTIRLARRGVFRGGHTTAFGLREGAVGLGKVSPRVPRSFIAQIRRIRREIVSGRIKNIPATVP